MTKTTFSRALSGTSGVDKTIVFPSPSQWSMHAKENYYNSNDYIADVCSQYPEQTLPVMTVNPRYEGATVLGEMERAVRELGARAIKLYPTYNHYRPDDRELC